MKILFLVSGMDAGAVERVASILVNAWAQGGNRVWLVPTFSGRGNVFYKLFAARLFYLLDALVVWTVSRFWRGRVPLGAWL